MREEVLLYWLSKSKYIAKAKMDVLVHRYGSLEEAFREIRKKKFQTKIGIGKALYDRLYQMADYERLCLEMDGLRKKGIGITTIFSDSYPIKLKNIHSAPICLYYRGKLPEHSKTAIAIVGSRAATARGIYQAGKIARELSMEGVAIISGMALGVDSAAHTGCMEGSSETFAVLGCGVDICYPKNNFSLYEKILQRGGILSEFPPGTEPFKTHFPLRNRMISGLSDGVLVVEATQKSGSLITADLGLEQGKNIYAVPGDPELPYHSGTNKLIQMGAKLVMTASDILEDYAFFRRVEKKDRKDLVLQDALLGLVYSVLGLEPRHISAITEETGIMGVELFHILFRLELLGYVKRVGFEYYVAVL